jgi:hypothetical protein
MGILGYTIVLTDTSLVERKSRDNLFEAQVAAVHVSVAECQRRLDVINSRAITGQTDVSYYHDMFEGRTMRCGKTFHQGERWLASNTFKDGTILIITNPRNGRTSWGVVGDGINKKYEHRTDTSLLIAAELDILEAGVVRCDVLAILPEVADERD